MTSSSKKNVYEVEGDTVSEGDTSDEECVESSKKSPTKTRSQKEGLELPSGIADNDSKPNRQKKTIWIGLILLAIAVVTGAVVGGVHMTKNKNTTPSTTNNSAEGNLSILAGNGEDMDSPAEGGTSTSTSTSTEQPPQESQQEEDSSSTLNIPKTTTATDESTTEQVIDDIPITNDNESKAEDVEAEEDATPTEWPDLVGMNGEDAKAQLELLYGEETYQIVVLNINSPTTRDYRLDRIRIFTDDEGVVVQMPRIG
eukprot:jgi/Psemu1/306352/fgenesh1_kg.251_\